MKLLIVFALLGLGFASANLRTEMDTVIGYLNIEEVRRIYQRYIAADREVAEIYSFLQSPIADEAFQILFANEEMREISAWANERGVDLYSYLSNILFVLGLRPIPPRRSVRGPVTLAGFGWRGMMDEIEAAMNWDGATAQAQVFINTPGSEYGELHRMIQAQHDPIHDSFHDPTVTRFFDQLRVFGVQVDETRARLYHWYGWDDHHHH
ncbi:uncharacterized protein LOC129752073 [Uranotaenia lowii]|uniref:uncharacterized protein LOC129752073 n=1 Tax=Uranotaenia lowii TaxID=190385 RepID=UPI002478EF05|nr:uncharacterized protein LOC129752073 [Uranotaenia lowii]